MKRIRLYVNTTKPEALHKATNIRKELKNQDYEISNNNEDIVIGFGGDGTLFHFLKDNNYDVTSKYIGVNCGTLGFLQDFDAQDACEFVTNIPSYIEHKLNFVELQVQLNGQMHKFYALNEFSVHHGEYKSFKTCVRIDEELLENYVGTGIVFSTPTGSTALGLSTGGAILHPSIEAIQMTPREAIVNSKMHSLSKSICLPKGKDIVLTPTNINESIAIDSDGEEVYRGLYDSVTICYSENGITKLKKSKDNFIQTIREKLI